MADRYWVGGTGSWNTTNTANWSATDGGAGGASVPTNADDVFFNSASGAVTVTVAIEVTCRALNFTGFTGTFAGTSSVLIYGDVFLSSAMTWTHSGTLSIESTSFFASSGKSITSLVLVAGSSASLTLLDALSTNNSITVSQGTFTTNNYNVTGSAFTSTGLNTRAINLGSSTVTLIGGGTVINLGGPTSLTFNAGTSSIVITGTNNTIAGSGKTFYDVSSTSTAKVGLTIQGANTFNNLSITGRASAGIASLIFSDVQIINGTLTLSAGTNATCRTFVRSDILGTTRTLTCNAVSATDIDFRDITIAGAAAPVSGTRLGDCKGNSGITFDAAKTVYWRGESDTWNSTAGWSDSDSTTGGTTFFPLAQDTAKFISSPASGGAVTLSAAYNIGTIDMSARTANTMTLSMSASVVIHGNWINGTGTTLSGTSGLTFAGRVTQAITSAGKTFTPPITINSPNTIVLLQDALTVSSTSTSAINLTYGTFDANGYNVTLTVGGVSIASQTVQRSLLLGSGTCTIGGGTFNVNGGLTNLVISGSGIINMIRDSSKTFSGAGVQTFPTLNQGGVGILTITGSNKFANITNTAIGRVQFTGGTTNEFDDFNLNGVAGNQLQLGSTNTTQAILKKPGNWNVGANSANAGNNTGLSFTAGSINYLSISYINGQLVLPPSANAGNFFAFFT